MITKNKEYEIISTYGIKLLVSEKVYKPAEDSFLLLETAEKIIDCNNKSLLELGCGAGLISIYFSKRGCSIVATDISDEATGIAKLNAKLNGVNIKILVGDLFEPVRGLVFDYIVFNPPYLPRDEMDFLIDEEYLGALVGGDKGNEIILRFLNELPHFLADDGIALFVASSLSGLEEIFKACRNNNLLCEIVSRKHFFFEDIFVIKAIHAHRK